MKAVYGGGWFSPNWHVDRVIHGALKEHWSLDNATVAWLYGWLCKGEPEHLPDAPLSAHAVRMLKTCPTLGAAVFGMRDADRRRAAWKEASKPWGFGSMRALWTAGILKHRQTQEPEKLNGRNAMAALGGVCRTARDTGDLDGFDAWLTGCIVDAVENGPMANKRWLVGRPAGRPESWDEEPGVHRDRAYVTACMEHMTPEGMKRLAETARMVLHIPEYVEEPKHPVRFKALIELKSGDLDRDALDLDTHVYECPYGTMDDCPYAYVDGLSLMDECCLYPHDCPVASEDDC